MLINWSLISYVLNTNFSHKKKWLFLHERLTAQRAARQKWWTHIKRREPCGVEPGRRQRRSRGWWNIRGWWAPARWHRGGLHKRPQRVLLLHQDHIGHMSVGRSTRPSAPGGPTLGPWGPDARRLRVQPPPRVTGPRHVTIHYRAGAQQQRWSHYIYFAALLLARGVWATQYCFF